MCSKDFDYKGLDFPWDISFGDTPAHTNRAACPEQGSGHTEIHISGDIAYLAWQRWQATHDVAWLRAVGWPLIKGVVEYYTSRVTPLNYTAAGAPAVLAAPALAPAPAAALAQDSPSSDCSEVRKNKDIGKLTLSSVNLSTVEDSPGSCCALCEAHLHCLAYTYIEVRAHT